MLLQSYRLISECILDISLWLNFGHISVVQPPLCTLNSLVQIFVSFSKTSQPLSKA